MARPPALVTRLCLSREQGDCAITSLATLGDFGYSVVLAAVTRRYRKWKPGQGLRVSQIVRVAGDLGLRLRWRDMVDEDTYGLLVVPGHVCVVRAAMVVETDGTATIYELADWLAIHTPASVGVLVPVE